MFQRAKFAAIAAVVSLGSAAAADTVNLEYTGVVNHRQVTVQGEGTYLAGHMAHTVYDAGGNAVGSFNSFCIELGETANNGRSDYQIVALTDAPEPGAPGQYNQTQADAVIAVVSKAIDLGWIDTNLQIAGANRDQIAAIQGAIWAALFPANTVSGNGDVNAALATLNTTTLNNSTFNMMANRLRAAVAVGEQDMLYVVPLPTAAWAGLGMLGLGAGVRTIRRR